MVKLLWPSFAPFSSTGSCKIHGLFTRYRKAISILLDFSRGDTLRDLYRVISGSVLSKVEYHAIDT